MEANFVIRKKIRQDCQTRKTKFCPKGGFASPQISLNPRQVVNDMVTSLQGGKGDSGPRKYEDKDTKEPPHDAKTARTTWRRYEHE